MKHRLPILIMIAFFALGLFPKIALGTNNAPRVVASITPFQTLIASLMEGIASKPQLLVKNGGSPHDYSLRPSDLKLLKEADIIFWAGPNLESFLIKPLNTIVEKQKPIIIQLDKTPGLLLLPTRNSTGEQHEHAEGDNCTHALIDMHFWLDPNNAILLTDLMAKTLSNFDPLHANIYKQNANRFKIQLKALDSKIVMELKEVKATPFIVFHDAYQYFEHHYGLKGVGAITLNPEVPPSVKRLRFIRQTIEKTKAHCVFSEPQFQPKLVQSIVQDLPIKTGELDPLGKGNSSSNGYFVLLENLADSLKSCLKQ